MRHPPVIAVTAADLKTTTRPVLEYVLEYVPCSYGLTLRKMKLIIAWGIRHVKYAKSRGFKNRVILIEESALYIIRL